MRFYVPLMTLAFLAGVFSDRGCRRAGEGCKDDIPCCAGFKCDIVSPPFGFCKLEGTGNSTVGNNEMDTKKEPSSSTAASVSSAAASQTKAPAPAASKAPQTTAATTIAPATTVAAAPAPTSANSSMQFQEFTGKATYFDIGLGACGWTNTNSEMVAAISDERYGKHANPNKAPICGKCAVVKFEGKEVKVKVVDRCPKISCKLNDWDLSPVAFEKLANKDLGHIQVKWHFVEC